MNKTRILTIFVIIAMMFSCADESSGPANVSLKIRSSSSAVASTNKSFFEKALDFITGEKLYAYNAGNNVIITDFQMAFDTVKLDKLNESTSEIEFAGPFQVDLLNDTQSLTETIGSGEITAGTYKKIRFTLHKSSEIDATHVLFDRSVYISGTINGVNFIMHHDASENMEIESDTGIEVNADTTGLLADFNLDNLLAGIDLTTALDSNSDGLIDISPTTSDDNINRNLADALKENIKILADFLEE